MPMIAIFTSSGLRLHLSNHEGLRTIVSTPTVHMLTKATSVNQYHWRSLLILLVRFNRPFGCSHPYTLCIPLIYRPALLLTPTSNTTTTATTTATNTGNHAKKNCSHSSFFVNFDNFMTCCAVGFPFCLPHHSHRLFRPHRNHQSMRSLSSSSSSSYSCIAFWLSRDKYYR